VVIMATIPLPKHDAREHDQTAVSLWFLGRSSLYRISIMGVFSPYYHLFNQNFTGRYDSMTVWERCVTLMRVCKIRVRKDKMGHQN